MLRKIPSVFVVYRHKTLTGSTDPTHANGTDKPCKNVPENCMKMKEIGAGRRVLRTPGSTNDQSIYPLEIALNHNVLNETFPINANTR